MAEARYEVRDTAGQPVAGDDVFDDQLKFTAAQFSGTVVDTRKRARPCTTQPRGRVLTPPSS